jgi:hypothetical protein
MPTIDRLISVNRDLLLTYTYPSQEDLDGFHFTATSISQGPARLESGENSRSALLVSQN